MASNSNNNDSDITAAALAVTSTVAGASGGNQAPTRPDGSDHRPRQQPVRQLHQTDRSAEMLSQEARWCMIYKVPQRLREVNEKAYEPNVISIGPYHYGKQHLMAMEHIKQTCYDKILKETHGDLRREFWVALSPLEPRLRQCYEQPLHPDLQTRENFIQMMVIDGCFIVQLIRKVIPDSDLLKVGRIQTDIWFDLLLLENQIPFFVIFELYRLMVPNAAGQHAHFLARLALSNLFNVSASPNFPNQDVKHLLGLAHTLFHPSPLGIMQHQNFKASAVAIAAAPAGAAGANPQQRSWKFIRSATELEGAGIGFFGDVVEKMKDQGQGIEGLFDIVFTKDTKQLRIPTLAVTDLTEPYFRNLIAYEQFIPSEQPTYVVDYVAFMDNLINTGEDVELLCEAGVIDNWLGDNEAVAQMFNKLRDSVYTSEDFYYAEIFDRLNQHCDRKWNKWMVALKKDYFNNPWSLISFLAALVLLLLTILQTIFSVLAYF